MPIEKHFEMAGEIHNLLTAIIMVKYPAMGQKPKTNQWQLPIVICTILLLLASWHVLVHSYAYSPDIHHQDSWLV